MGQRLEHLHYSWLWQAPPNHVTGPLQPPKVLRLWLYTCTMYHTGLKALHSTWCRYPHPVWSFGERTVPEWGVKQVIMHVQLPLDWTNIWPLHCWGGLSHSCSSALSIKGFYSILNSLSNKSSSEKLDLPTHSAYASTGIFLLHFKAHIVMDSKSCPTTRYKRTCTLSCVLAAYGSTIWTLK